MLITAVLELYKLKVISSSSLYQLVGNIHEVLIFLNFSLLPHLSNNNLVIKVCVVCEKSWCNNIQQ